MYRIFLALIIMSTFSLSVFATSYKINTSGKVTTPSGQVQQNNAYRNQTNLYNNYSSQQYVASKQVTVNQVGTILIIMDYSGSMANWIDEAKRSMSQIIAQLPSSTKIGFRVFGHDGGGNSYNATMGIVKKIIKNSNGKYKVATVNNPYLGNTSGSCSATARVSPIMTKNPISILAGMNSVNVGGSTPLTYALEQGINQDFAGLATNYPKKIVLITDGGENCGGDPCAFAKNLMTKRKDVHIDVVLVSSNSKSLKCLTDTTGGKFYNTNDLSSFSNVLTQSMQSNSVQNKTPAQPQQGQQYEFIDF